MKRTTVSQLSECQTLCIFLFTGSKVLSLHHLSLIYCLSLKHDRLSLNPSMELTILRYLKTAITFQVISSQQLQ